MRMTTGTLINSPAVHRAYDRFMDWLVEKRYFPYPLNAHRGHRYVAMWDNGEVISILCYTICEWDNSAEIRAAWTHEDYRRLGLYSKLFDKLVEIGNRKGLRSIDSGYNSDNVVSANMQKKRGSVITERYGKDIATSYYLEAA